MHRDLSKLPSLLRGGLWSGILGLLVCGAPAAHGQWQRTAPNTYLTTASDSVGVGTATPVSKFHLFTSGQVRMTVESSSADAGLEIRANSRRWTLGINIASLGSGKFFIYDSTPGVGASRFMIDTGGNVGIGTNSPVSRLHVATADQTQVSIESTSGSATDTALDLRANGRRWATGINVFGVGAGKFSIFDATAGVLATRLLIDANGYVGIGTATPRGKLDIRGDLFVGWDEANTRVILKSFTTHHAAGNVPSELLVGIADGWVSGMSVKNFRDGTANSHTVEFSTSWGGVNAGTRLFIDKVGNVGIGTTAPLAKLVVLGTEANNTIGAGSSAVLRLVNSDYGAVGRLSELQFGVGANSKFAAISGLVSDASNNTRGDIVFGTRNMPADANLTERMRIDGIGNVGIGTTNPTTRLHVVGDLTVTGNIAAKYQDVAEWVPSTQRIRAGTVVALDAGRTNAVLASTVAYDTKVAGVVSEKPGLILGERDSGKVLVATTGRVKVRADARQGPIRIGDLLVTSGREGVAMRSEPVIVSGIEMHRPGTLIGKALENLEAGEGEILVLLSLQ